MSTQPSTEKEPTESAPFLIGVCGHSPHFQNTATLKRVKHMRFTALNQTLAVFLFYEFIKEDREESNEHRDGKYQSGKVLHAHAP